MRAGNVPGGNPLITLTSWLIALIIGSIVIQILMTELVRWVTVLAPWLLLLFIIAVVSALIAVVVRRRNYGY